MERRQFIFQTSALAASGILVPNLFSEASRIKKIGIQLYTLRDLMKDDCVEVLKELGNQGYKEIESYPSQKGHFWGRPAKDFFALAADNNLKVISTHIPYGKPVNPEATLASVTKGFEAFAEAFAKEGGKFIVCPYLDKSLRISLDNYKSAADDFNKAGQICKNLGIQFAYHNHDFEFIPIDSTIPYYYLLKNTDPNLVKMELDLYWAKRGQQSIEELFTKNPGRFPLVHVKDMAASDKSTVEVGNGTIPFAEIFKLSKTAGIEHYLVEQDNCIGSPLDCVRKSFQYLKKLRY